MRTTDLLRYLVSVTAGIFLTAWMAQAQAPVGKPPQAAPKPKTSRVQPPDVATTLKAEQDAAPLQSVSLYREANYQPSNRRDPFLNPLLLRKKDGSEKEQLPRGAASPGIAGMYIAEVKLMGTSIAEDIRTAVFAGTDRRVYFLRKGDRLYDGFVQSISTEAVVLVRETHFKSGQTSTEEVTKRLRNP